MSFLRNTTKRGGANKRGISGAAEAAARFGARPTPATKNRTGIFRDHFCWKCADGTKPCAEGSPNICGYPRALND